jgi:hypothetical protein
MLAFIADLYQLVMAPDPEPAPVDGPARNGREPAEALLQSSGPG